MSHQMQLSLVYMTMFFMIGQSFGESIVYRVQPSGYGEKIFIQTMMISQIRKYRDFCDLSEINNHMPRDLSGTGRNSLVCFFGYHFDDDIIP